MFIFVAQMKRVAAYILLLCYFVFSTGFVVSVHYCMNKVDSVQLGDSSSDECGKCGMHIEDSNGCCKDDVKLVKVEIDQAVAKTLSPNFSVHFTPVVTTENYTAPLLNSIREDFPLTHGPPLSEQDTYLQNCVFRL